MIRKCSAFAAVMLVLFGFSLLSEAQDSDGQRLLDAAKTGQVGTVQKLLDPKVSPKAKDENGRTPLHLAAANGHQVIAEALLRAGAEINALDQQGKTPLDLAEAGGHSGLAAFLLGKGGKKAQVIATSGRPPQTTPDKNFTTLVEKCLEDFESIKAGMTRREVESKLAMDGGIQGVSPVRFTHPTCPIFKIDVEFDFHKNAADQNRAVLGKDDKVIHASKPYIERPFLD
jgi:ankyrin repeat protein